MAFIIIMSNSGGELERRTAKDGQEAASVLASMVEGNDLADGDTFKVIDEDEDRYEDGEPH